MRTKGQQKVKPHKDTDKNRITGIIAMLKELKNSFHRSQSTLAQDAVGLISLVVILVVGLHLPLIA